MFNPDMEIALEQMEKEACLCPFCAHKDVIYCEDHGIGFVRCENCAARGPVMDTPEGAFELWDIRKGGKK